jgi:hypothetical protein
MKRKRPYTRTTVSLHGISVDEALAALLKTPPPPADVPGARKSTVKKKRKGR